MVGFGGTVVGQKHKAQAIQLIVSILERCAAFNYKARLTNDQ